MYATKEQLNNVEKNLDKKIDTKIDLLRGELRQDINDAVDRLGRMMVTHFYTKDEIDKRFYNKNEIDKRFDHVENELLLFRIEFENFKMNDFKQVLECVEGMNQKLDILAKEPKAMKLQGEVDELRGRVIRLEKR